MNSFCVSSSYLSFFFFFFSPAFAWGSVFLPSVIRLLSNLFPSLSQFLLLSAPQSAPSRFGPIPPLTLSRTHMHTTQNCAHLDGWSPSAPPLSPSCLMQSAAPYWLGSATAASCAAVCLRDTKASCEPGHVLTGWKNTWQKKVWAEFRSCWKVNCGAFVLKTGCRRRKDFPLRGLTIMLRNTPDTLKEGKGEISKLYLFTTSSYVSCSCYCNNNPKSNMYSGKVYNTKNVLIVVKML